VLLPVGRCPFGPFCFGHLAKAQANTPAVRLDAQHAQQEQVTRRHKALRVIRTDVSHLRDMQQTLDATAQPHERAEVRHACDDSLNQLVGLVKFVDVAPGIGLNALQAQAHALALLVDPKHLDVDDLPDLQHFTRVCDREPGELRNVHQAISPTQVHERAKLRQAAHCTLSDLTHLDVVQQLLAVLALPATPCRALGHDQAAALAVHLDDLDWNRFPDVGRQLRLALIRRHFARERRQMGGRHKSTQLAEDHLEAASVVTADRRLEHLVVLHLLLRDQPILLLKRTRQ